MYEDGGNIENTFRYLATFRSTTIEEISCEKAGEQE